MSFLQPSENYLNLESAPAFEQKMKICFQRSWSLASSLFLFINEKNLSSDSWNFINDSWSRDNEDEPRGNRSLLGPRECLDMHTLVYANGVDGGIDCSGTVEADLTILTKEAYSELLSKFQQLEKKIRFYFVIIKRQITKKSEFFTPIFIFQ